MKRAALSLLLLAGFTWAQSEQVQRGEKLFFESPKGLPCATCHQINGKGTPAGPDLKNIAGISPRGIVTAVLSSRTMYVVEVESQTGGKFPAIQHGEGPDGVVLYELTKNQPVERKLRRAEIKAIRDNMRWKHPPESTGYAPAELADVIAYIRFATKGITTPVSAADVTKTQ